MTAPRQPPPGQQPPDEGPSRDRAELTVAGVWPLAQMWSGLDPAIDEAKAEFSDRVGAAAKSVGAKGERVLSTSPARGLHDRAERIEADLIVVGSCRRGRLGQTLTGSVGVALLPRSTKAPDTLRRLGRGRSGADGREPARA